MMRVITSAILLLILMNCTQVNAGLGQPAKGSDQSGIGLVSGWYCDASQIEVSFDGGPLIEAPYGSTRNDTIKPCGDDDNGFGLLWNYNLLGPGKHSVDVYADGNLFDSSVFTVTTLGGEFLRGKQSNRRVYGFPDLDHDVTLKWQEGSQNYAITGSLPSINSFDVEGLWESYYEGDFAGGFSIHISPSVSEPLLSEVLITMIDGSLAGAFLVGAMSKNRALIETSPDLGALVTIDFEVEFIGPRRGYMAITNCSPIFTCSNIGFSTGDIHSLEKFYPFAETDVLPQSNTGEGSFTPPSLEESFRDTHRRLAEELKVVEESISEQPSKGIGRD